MGPPPEMAPLSWEAELARIDVERDAAYILARVLERGTLEQVCWAIHYYGYQRIHEFFRGSGHPEISRRTLAFWRAFFEAEDEEWRTPPAWRSTSGVPWPL